MNKGRIAAYLLVPLALVGAVLGGEYLLGEKEAVALAPTDLPQPGYGPADHTAALQFVADQLATWRERAELSPDEWLPQAGLAHALTEYAGLTGDYAALAEAQAVMARATALAPYGAGPTLEAAHTALAGHQLDRVEAALALMQRSVVADAPEQLAEARSLAGDVAFYRGNLVEADQLYSESLSLAPGAGSLYRQAVASKARGQLDQSAALFVRSLSAAEETSPQTVANFALQLGAVEQARGDYAAALGWFRRADALFPGNWAIISHVAQAEYLTGAHAPALARLERLLARDPKVESMELYALLLGAQGREAEARPWVARAAAAWEERLALLPKASYGHAIEHQLKFGTPERGLELARLNFAARPYGEARLLLAETLLATDQPAAALAQIRAAREAGWQSAPQLRAEVNALEALGREDEARSLREEALAINPHVFGPLSELVWFGHG